MKIFKIFKNSKVFRVFVVTIVLLAVVSGYIFLSEKEGKVSIDNSQISAPVINISPDLSGKVLDLRVQAGDVVKRGDILAIVGSQIVKAYEDGIIIQVNNQTGSITSNAAPLIQMINMNDMRVVGTIDENKGLRSIKPGQVVSFSVDAIEGKTYMGYIDRVAPTAKQTQLSFSISSERPVAQFEVYARFNVKSYPEIKNGMSAKMTVYTKN